VASTVVISIEIPRELKERMERISGVNWSEVIRKLLEEVVARYEAEAMIRRVEQHLGDVPELPLGTASRWVRSDREGHRLLNITEHTNRVFPSSRGVHEAMDSLLTSRDYHPAGRA